MADDQKPQLNTAVVVVNFQTPDLLSNAVASFRSVYPAVLMLIVDNGSRDNSRKVIEGMQSRYAHTSALFLEKNIFHGPAMHRAAREVKSDFLFFLDSDTETRRGGFLEVMLKELQEEKNLYAIGRVNHVNKRGFPAEEGTAIVLSPYMMVKREIYFTLPPFEHRGMPTLGNFSAAQQRGWVVLDFPIQEYIEHKGRGTASLFGYGLGMRGKVEYLLNKIGL
ncbi:MAG: glycosyltransferase family 2 protein [Bacteroidota bacterium]|nr:glycosyltransferase family 2 protein [Bacteroidota bacterium]